MAEFGKTRDISVMGYCDNIADYYAVADIFIYAPVKEGMPNALLEAMASGLPCVVTKFMGLSKDFGDDYNHYLLAEETPEGLSEKVIKLLEETDLRQYISNNASTLMQKTMSMNRIIDRYYDLYRNLTKAD